MTKPGPSPEYRDLLSGRITPDEYVKKVKRDVSKHLRSRPLPPNSRPSAPR
jgi:hypothetical protein